MNLENCRLAHFAEKYWQATCLLAASHVFGLTWPPPGLAQRARVIGHWGCNPGIAWVVGHLATQWNHQEPFCLVVGTGHATSFLFAHRAIVENWSAKRITEASASYAQPGGDPSEILGIPHFPYQGGELGAALAVTQSMATFGSQILTTCVIGDGECETPATLAAFAHADVILGKSTSPRGNAWLPIINANGARMGSKALWNHEALSRFLKGLGFQVLISGDNPSEANETAANAIKASLEGQHVVWISVTEKGWPAPPVLSGRSMRSHSAHKPRGIDPTLDSTHAELSCWLATLRNSDCLEADGSFPDRLITIAQRVSLQSLPPQHTPKSPFIELTVSIRAKPTWEEPVSSVDKLLTSRRTRVFSPDEASSNRMKTCLEAGLVDEVLAEELCAAWTWGAIESGCEAVFATYEAFSPLTSTLIAQYAKLIHTRPDAGRPPLVVLLTSLSWANCPTHQNTDLVATVLARPIPKMRLICPIGASSAAERVQALLESPDTIGIVVCSKQPLLDLPDPGSSAIEICVRNSPQHTATIVALGDVCITEAVAAMTSAAKVGIDIRVIAIAELSRALARAPIEAPPAFEPSTIGAVWCAPSLVAPALWSNVGFSFPIFGYCERWGATAWETLRANSLDRNSLLRVLSKRDLFPSTALDSLEDQLRSQESQPLDGGVIPFDCPSIETRRWSVST